MPLKQRIKFAFTTIRPLLLRHHPFCNKFEGHTFKIKGIDFCIGCFMGYPTAIITLIILPLSGLFNILTPIVLFIISIILLSSLILSFVGLTKKKPIKFLQKILIGMGGAFLFWSIFTLPNPSGVNLIVAVFSFGLLLALFNGYHGYGMYRICKKCEFEADWDNCPGMSMFNPRKIHE